MKSDSRVSIRRPGQGMPAPLSQRVVMPDSLPKYTDRTADMTGLIARRSRHSRGDGSDVVTSLGTNPPARALLSFQGPHRSCAEGLSEQARTASRATTQYIGGFALDPADQARPARSGTEECSGDLVAAHASGHGRPQMTWSGRPTSCPRAPGRSAACPPEGPCR